MTGIAIGMALGSFASGRVVDNYGAENGFWVSVVAGIASALIVALGQHTHSGSRQTVVLGHTLPAE
jgi:predicted MFS family arabinose efflux permease